MNWLALRNSDNKYFVYMLYGIPDTDNQIFSQPIDPDILRGGQRTRPLQTADEQHLSDMDNANKYDGNEQVGDMDVDCIESSQMVPCSMASPPPTQESFATSSRRRNVCV